MANPFLNKSLYRERLTFYCHKHFRRETRHPRRLDPSGNRDSDGGDIILTSYFTSRMDPQRLAFTKPNNYEYIRNWYESILAHDLRGIIFHDNLNREFTARQENEKVSFRQCKLGPYSLNDERFFIYREWLRASPVRNVFLTDLSDVAFNGNPFGIIKHPRCIYVGHEENRRFGETKRNRTRVRRLSKYLSGNMNIEGLLAQRLYNAGIIGGEKSVVLFLLDKMISAFEKIDSPRNYNMLVFNICLHNFFRDGKRSIFSGSPLHSRFNTFEKGGETEALIIHK